MKYYNITWALALMTLASGCKTDTIEVNPPAEPGTEVNFSAALAPSTRTIYGDESSTGIAVNWVKGDAVRISSPQCQNSSSVAYDVNIGNAESLNYAVSLDKQESVGLRWGNQTSGYNFYSIYPANENTSLNGSTAKLNISPTQYCGITTLPTGTGQMLNLRPYMANAVMYAATRDVSSDAKSVNLRYEPYATVLDVTLKGPKNEATIADKVTIQRITLTAPEETNISGDFTFNFTDADTQSGTPVAPKVADAGDSGSNSITLVPLIWEDPSKPDNGRLLALDKINYTSARVKFFIIPKENMTIGTGWTITVETPGGNFSMDLGTVTNGALTPGAIHKMTLPNLDATQAWTYDPKNWLTSLPDYKNIYLSEITLPGAWYGARPEYQGDNVTWQGLYDKGVRAFGVETRTLSSLDSHRISTANYATAYVPQGVVVSGTGTGTGGNGAYISQIGRAVTHISSVMQNLVNAIGDDEFAVLALSYADGGTGGHRPADYGYWLQGIHEEYNSLSQTYKNKIYTGTLDENTTVNDVLGKLIIKVNVDSRITSSWNITADGSISGSYTWSGSYVNNIPGLLSFTDLSWETSKLESSLVSQMSYKTFPNKSNLDGSITSLSPNALYWNYTAANRSTPSLNDDGVTNNNQYIPSQRSRRNSILTIVRNSEAIYNEGTHNVWFFVGAGGNNATTTDEDTNQASAQAFANLMNPWILEVLKAKLNGTALPDANGNIGTGANLKPSPLGMVMCNFITDETYSGPDIIDAIIRINSVIELEHKPIATTPQLNVARFASHMKKSPNGWMVF